jgi:hypothetical protein
MSKDDHDFNPNSVDATLAKILANQDNAVSVQRAAMAVLQTELREHRAETRACFEKMSEKVGHIEKWRDNIRAKLAVASAGVSLLAAVFAEWAKTKFGGGGGHGP